VTEKQHPAGWHWPSFENNSLCGLLTDRERLGLPDHYVADRFSEELPAAFARLRVMTKDELLEHCEQTKIALVDRLAVGNILAKLGDPRIKTLHPAMVPVKGGCIEIGLCFDNIEAVLAQYPNLGLERKWIAKECPRHNVNIRSFAIAKYPITNQEYRDFLLDSHFSEIPTSWAFRRYPEEYSNHPVYTVSAKAADAYCCWLAEKTGRRFRLPTEAEWEYAAAGPDGLEFPWGAEFDADLANTSETGLFQTSPIGIFAGGNSPFGVADMAGNVEEYVTDDYAAYPGGEFISDHLVEIHGKYRVARGGSFARFRDLARTRRRHGHNPRSIAYAMGFRVAEDVGISSVS
jgi:formylglycine-generating enzyme required for sulfatase activity